MYAIVKVGGKQYRVEQGDSLLVDRMAEQEGAKVALEPLLLKGDGKDDVVFAGDDLAKVKVEAVVKSHERGPKVHVLKFKPKRGYKRRYGHRSDLTRIEVGDIKLLSRKPAATKAADESRKTGTESKTTTKTQKASRKDATGEAGTKKAPAAKRAPAAKKTAATKKPAATKKLASAKKPASKQEDGNGA